MADIQSPAGAELGARDRPSQQGGACPTCGQRFTGDARFCPYDGEPLVAPAAERPPDRLLGTVLDRRYEVLQVLGEGGMGTVYRARHSLLGRHFALKVLRAELATDADLSKRFIREAKAAAAIAHPNVVQICDFGELPSGQPYFVMELLEGRSLSTVIWREGALPPAAAVRVLRQVAEGLAAAHAAGVVHRDLKPDNIHIAELGGRQVVKVLDFGLAKVAGASKLTKNGIVYGTPHYMSPEQAAGEAVDHRADIYALGVVLYESLTGRVPFDADTYMGILTKHLYTEPAPPSVWLPSGTPLAGLDQVTLRCLEKKPAKRYGTMSDLVRALERSVELSESGQYRVRSGRPPTRAAPPLEEQPSRQAEPVAPMAAEPLRRAGVRWALGGAVAGAVLAGGWIALSWLSGPGASPSGLVQPPLPVSVTPVPRSVEPVVLPVPMPSGPRESAPQAETEPIQERAPGTAQRPGSAGPRRVKSISPRKTGLSGGEIIDPWAK